MKIECHDPKRSLRVAAAFRTAAFQAAADTTANDPMDFARAARPARALRPGRPRSVRWASGAQYHRAGDRSSIWRLKRHESHPSRNL